MAAQKKDELQDELADLGQSTEGSKAELEERLEEVKEKLGLVEVVEANADTVKENEEFAKQQAREAKDAPSTPMVYEARKTK